MIAAALLFAGCASAGILPGGLKPVCAPPGLPDPSTWRLLEAEPVVLNTEDKRLLVAVKAYGTAQGYQLKLIWIDGLLAMVDPAPDDPNAAIWIDAQIIADTGYVLPAPRWQSCEWKPYYSRRT